MKEEATTNVNTLCCAINSEIIESWWKLFTTDCADCWQQACIDKYYDKYKCKKVSENCLEICLQLLIAKHHDFSDLNIMQGWSNFNFYFILFCKSLKKRLSGRIYYLKNSLRIFKNIYYNALLSFWKSSIYYSKYNFSRTDK